MYGGETVQIYEFADFRLIPEDGLLLRNGETVPLTPKAFTTLTLLVKHQGRLVKKTDLIEQVWDNAFVEEAAVSRCIWSIRTALGSNSKDQKYIQTVPKRGYRFIEKVTTINGDEKPEPMRIDNQSNPFHLGGSEVFNQRRATSIFANFPSNAAAPLRDSVLKFPAKVETDEDQTRRRIPGRVLRPIVTKLSPYTFGALLILAVVVSFAVYSLFIPSKQHISATATIKIAVLPLKPVIADQGDLAFEFAIAESLIHKLSEAKNLDVKRLYSVREYVDLEKDPVDAGRELGVDYVLASNYQLNGGKLRITSYLMKVSTGNAEQTFKSETNVGDVFSVQDYVANEIGNAVSVNFGAPVTHFTHSRGTKSEEAYNIYNAASYLIDKGTADDSAKAAEMLGRAVELDENYAQAWALRAQSVCQFGHLGGGEPNKLFAYAEPMLEKALAIDPNNATVYMVRATINRDYHWNFEEAYKDLQKSIEVDPGFAPSYRILAGLYYRDGRFAEAVETEKKALDLDPTSLWDNFFLGIYLEADGRTDEGIAQLIRVTEMDRQDPAAYYSLWRIYHLRGDGAKAFEYFLKSEQLKPNNEERVAQFNSAYQASGWKGVLRLNFDFVRAGDTKGKYSPLKIYIAELAAQLGENDMAYQYLEEAMQFRLIGFSFIRVNRLLKVLRDEPRFKDLVKRAGI